MNQKSQHSLYLYFFCYLFNKNWKIHQKPLNFEDFINWTNFSFFTHHSCFRVWEKWNHWFLIGHYSWIGDLDSWIWVYQVIHFLKVYLEKFINSEFREFLWEYSLLVFQNLINTSLNLLMKCFTSTVKCIYQPNLNELLFFKPQNF